MTKRLCIILALILVGQLTWTLASEKDFDDKRTAVAKSMLLDLSDRASGIHNASNIGLFFENYGRFSYGSFLHGNAGEFPINSNHNYLYLMSTMVGVAPDASSGRSANVMTSLYTSDWSPLPGYHQPPDAEIAFSDKPATWPSNVWFHTDEENEPIIVSSQDSYCVYNDTDNQNEVLGIQIAQTGYAFGLSDFEDIIFFTFELTNHSAVSYDSVYFGLYHDFDIGNDPGGNNDFSDDMLKFDSANDFITFSDADNYSIEWGQEPGMMGIALLESPKINGSMAGITDMHYGIFENSEATQMVLLSSNLDYLPDGVSPEDFFNTGTSPDIHFDDPGIIPSSGMDTHGTISSGPFDLSPTDTLTFIIGIIAGINEADLYKNLYIAQNLHANDFVGPTPPSSPTLTGLATHNKVTLYWTNAREGDFDELSGARNFEGYRLYKSIDRGLNWDQIDRNVVPDIGLEPIPFTSFDRINGWGDDTGLQYTYVDNSVVDGFEYWYSITSFDHGISLIESLESPIGNTVEASNVISIIPVSTPGAYEAAEASNLTHFGGGDANYILNVNPCAPEQLSNYRYDLHFLYDLQNEIGNPGIWASVEIIDSSFVSTTNYGISFTAVDQIDIINLDTQNSLWAGGLYLGYPYPFGNEFSITFFRTDTINVPSPGDLLSLNFCAELLRFDGYDTLQVIAPQRFDPGRELVSDDGLILSLNPQPPIQNINAPPILDFEIELEVADLDSIQEMDYQITIIGSGVDSYNKTFIVLNTTDQDATIIGAADTLYSGWGIQYSGWTAWFEFDPAHLPPQGTSATFSTLAPIPPGIQDYYRFGIVDGSTNEDLLADELSHIRVVPNPYMAGSHWESELGSYVREPVRQIQFTHLPLECEINIFTLSGDLIKTLEHDASHGTETWDMRAEGGREIVSGIYLYQVKSGGNECLNRFAVIK